MHRRITFVLILALALLLAGTGHSTAAPAAQADLPPAPIVDDEGGPKRLTGSLDYTDFAIRIIMQNPAPALIDMVHVVQGDQTQFAPVASQILGRMTAPVFPPPLRYAFDLPAEPTATLLDVDNDGATDTGVQIFKLIVSANLNGLSHLEQLDQASDTVSYLTDPVTGAITEGNLLVYAPDDQQGFPSGFGAADLAAVLAQVGISDPTIAPVATRTANGAEWAIYASPDSPPFAFRVAVAQIDGKWRVIRIGTSVEII